MRRLRSFVARPAWVRRRRVCVCHPRERIIEPDGTCYRCLAVVEVSPSLDELRRAEGRPIRVSAR